MKAKAGSVAIGMENFASSALLLLIRSRAAVRSSAAVVCAGAGAAEALANSAQAKSRRRIIWQF